MLTEEISEVAPQAPARQAVQQQTRMPRVDEFPPVVQSEMDRRSGHDDGAEERGALGLIRKLTSGLSRREAEEVEPHHGERRQQPEHSPYAPRRVAADSAARPVSQVRPQSEDEQLEIPAFLRRQSS